MIRTNQNAHRTQLYFVPKALQSQLGLPLNRSGFVEKAQQLLIKIEENPSISAVANGHGSIGTANHELRDWFANLGENARFEVGVCDKVLVFSRLRDREILEKP